MIRLSGQDIRELFISFFKDHGHLQVPSSSLVPLADPTLLFTNAGMNQFKDYFTGQTPAPQPRAVTIQKCVRAGGKHNDLENVGHTARHHTFFEMLGNFSFGDYFKEEACVWAWEFLTSKLKISPEKLLVTVHHRDQEAYDIWAKKIRLSPDKIFKKGDRDNYWEMGEFGPCGPCSEIFYDHGEKYRTPNWRPGQGQDILDDERRYVEIWNLVFMEDEKTPEGTAKLPHPCIDTGAGLERLAAVMQNCYWNYDTDLFTPLISRIEQLSQKKYGDQRFRASMRIVADHIKAATMLITDGVIPQNEGRGHVLRRVMRRAIRHWRELSTSSSLSGLIPEVFTTLAGAYPQNLANKDLAEKMISLEEKKFLETLDMGLKYLQQSLKKELVGKTLPGHIAFKLYDTFGFPLDLTESILREKKLGLDKEGLSECLAERKEKSSKSWKQKTLKDNHIFFKLKEKFGETRFGGYTQTHGQATLLAKIEMEDEQLSALIFDTTPFYAEGGGQVGDQGGIFANSQEKVALATITQTYLPVIAGPIIHLCASRQAQTLKEGLSYDLRVDEKRRQLTACNHSATHLLQAALIQIIGPHIKQAGSLVGSEKLRFDFTHPKALTSQERQRVEALVNEQIQKALPVNSEVMDQKKALQQGALAFFGDKYGEQVRVLKMGSFSTEFCGGTHVRNTAEIQQFKMIAETSLSSGVRRIEALTSQGVYRYLDGRSEFLSQVESLLGEKGSKTSERIEQLLKEVKEKQKEVARLQGKLQTRVAETLFIDPEKLAGSLNLSFKAAHAPPGADLRALSDTFISKHPQGVLLLYTEPKGPCSFLLRSPKLRSPKTKKNVFDCSKLLQELLDPIGGKGGGRPDMAFGRGEVKEIIPFIAKLKEKLEKLP